MRAPRPWFIAFFVVAVLVTVFMLFGRVNELRRKKIPVVKDQRHSSLEAVLQPMNLTIDVGPNFYFSIYSGHVNKDVSACTIPLPPGLDCEVRQHQIGRLRLRGILPDGIVLSSLQASTNELNGWKTKGVVPFHMSMESASYYPNVAKLEEYATSVTYRRSTAEIPIIYIPNQVVEMIEKDNTNDYLRPPVYIDPGMDKVTHGACFVARNCASKSGREKFVDFFSTKYHSSRKASSDEFVFDSISGCRNNAPWPENAQRGDRFSAIRNYLFYFAFENSIEQDYVTEKVYSAMIAGNIPVYLGAPNIDEFVPPNSIIKVTDFNTTEELAEYLIKVQKSPSLYASYFKWRTEDTPEMRIFQEKMRPFSDPWYCRVCRYTYGMKLGYAPETWNRSSQQWNQYAQ